MFYRQARIFHTNYADDRKLFPMFADRLTIWTLLLFALVAPMVVSSLTLTSYLVPWLVWTAAILGLNLIIGFAGQFHFGYAAVIGIGAYTAVHAARHGVPGEIAIILGGAMSTLIGITFAFAALRVKGLYLALSTLALQFIVDWVISHVDAISGGVSATLQAPDLTILGQAIQSDAGLYYVALGVVPDGDLVHAEPETHGPWTRPDCGAGKRLCCRGDRGEKLLLQTGGLRRVLLYRWRQWRHLDLYVLPCGHSRTVFHHGIDPGARHGDCGRGWAASSVAILARHSSC